MIDMTTLRQVADVEYHERVQATQRAAMIDSAPRTSLIERLRAILSARSERRPAPTMRSVTRRSDTAKTAAAR